MPIVFVHGVNTRKEDPSYDVGVQLFHKFCAKHLQGVTLGGVPLANLTPSFPYWGDLATTFAWNMESLPGDGVNALGPGVDNDLRPLIAVIDDTLPDAKGAATQPLLTLAKRKSLAASVDLVAMLVMQNPPAGKAAEVADFIVAAQGYAAANPQPAWLAATMTDEQLLNRLVTEAKTAASTGVQALGAFDFISGPLAAAGAKLKGAVTSAATTVLDRTGDFASTKLLAWQRQPLNAILGRFFGDIFVYLDTRGDKGTEGAILKRIADAIDSARAANPNEPLMVVGHSLGGVISFDLLSYYRTDIDVALFASIGSQVSHFEEMKRYKSSDPNIKRPAKARTPANIKRWINIFDQVDIFSYACDKVFDRVVDFAYDTQTYVIKAHGAYFEQDRFYSRLRTRIDALP
jgi:hypothetical protein